MRETSGFVVRLARWYEMCLPFTYSRCCSTSVSYSLDNMTRAVFDFELEQVVENKEGTGKRTQSFTSPEVKVSRTKRRVASSLCQRARFTTDPARDSKQPSTLGATHQTLWRDWDMGWSRFTGRNFFWTVGRPGLVVEIFPKCQSNSKLKNMNLKLNYFPHPCHTCLSFTPPACSTHAMQLLPLNMPSSHWGPALLRVPPTL